MSGPESLTLAEQVRSRRGSNRSLAWFVEVSPKAARPEMLAVMPREIVDVLLDALARMTAGPAPVTAIVREITGATHTFREWASDHAADFR